MRIIKRGPIVECHKCKAQLRIKPKDCFITIGQFNTFEIICPCCKGISVFNRSEVPSTFYNDITTFAKMPRPKYVSDVPNEPVENPEDAKAQDFYW